MSLYVGINNSPKKVSRLLVGKNGTCSDATSAYTGGGGNSRNLIYSSKIDIDKELANANPVKALTSGQFTTADIGKTVYLSNSAITCQEWRIADVNHDSTTGTVDLFPKYTLANDTRVFDNSTQIYANSSLRTYLTGTVYNGFTSEVQSALKVQNFPSNGITLSDKVKCPSLNEVGCNKGYESYVIAEGTIYPIFGTQQLRPNNLAIYKTPAGNTCWYWTRSRYTGNSYSVWSVSYNGNCSNFNYSSSGCVVACLRF